MITPKNLLRHELIGLEVKIEKSTARSLEGLIGRVVDESYGTLTIETKKKTKKPKREKGGKKSKLERIVEKVIPKNNCIFIFTLPNGVKVQIDGRLLIGRPEDRIKKKFVRW